MSDEEIAQLRANAKLPLTIQLLDHIEALRAENERLREALKPFADAVYFKAGRYDVLTEDIQPDDVERARCALERKPE